MTSRFTAELRQLSGQCELKDWVGKVFDDRAWLSSLSFLDNLLTQQNIDEKTAPLISLIVAILDTEQPLDDWIIGKGFPADGKSDMIKIAAAWELLNEYRARMQQPDNGSDSGN